MVEIEGLLYSDDEKRLLSAYNSDESDIEIQNGVERINDSAFSGSDIESVVIAETVREIGDLAFAWCESLSEVKIPFGVEKIGECAFYHCGDLEAVYLPESICHIGLGAFAWCNNLSKIVLADNLRKIEEDWFKGLGDSCQIVCTENSPAYLAASKIPNVRRHVHSLAIADSKRSKIEQIQSAGVEAVLSALIGNIADSSVTFVRKSDTASDVLLRVWKNCGIFTLPSDSSAWIEPMQKIVEAFSNRLNSASEIYAVIKESPIAFSELSEEEIEETAFKGDSQNTLCLFCDGVLKKGDFSAIEHLEIIGCHTIDERAFCDNESLRSLVIHDGVEEIGYGAFEDCTALETVSLPKTLNELDSNAFEGCESLRSVVVPGKVREIGSCAFEGCTALSSVTIMDGVEEIGSSAFEDCSSLVELLIFDSVEKINDSAFEGCTSLKKIVLPESLREIEDHLFKDCTFLESVAIPDSVEKIGIGAFEGCISLSAITLPKSLRELGSWATFKDCKSLCEIKICENVKNIRSSSFENCTKLKSVSLPSTLKKIGEEAFKNCSLLSEILFAGTVEQWSNVEKDTNWNKRVVAKSVHCADGETEC